MEVKVWKKSKRDNVIRVLGLFNIDVESLSRDGLLTTKGSSYTNTRACAEHLLSDGVVGRDKLFLLIPVSGNMCAMKLEIQL